VVLDAPIALKTCETMGDDLAALESWASILMHPEALLKDVSKRYLLHHKEVKADIVTLENDWASGDYF
jgi:hypothetical protein